MTSVPTAARWLSSTPVLRKKNHAVSKSQDKKDGCNPNNLAVGSGNHERATSEWCRWSESVQKRRNFRQKLPFLTGYSSLISHYQN